MKLTSPVIITARLLPGVRIGDAFVSITFGKEREGRVQYLSYIDMADGKEYEITDHYSGVGGGSLQEGLSSLLSFLTAAAEAYSHKMRTGHASDNIDIFPVWITKWAYQHSDEIDMLAFELEETPNLITEE